MIDLQSDQGFAFCAVLFPSPEWEFARPPNPVYSSPSLFGDCFCPPASLDLKADSLPDFRFDLRVRSQKHCDSVFIATTLQHDHPVARGFATVFRVYGVTYSYMAQWLLDHFSRHRHGSRFHDDPRWTGSSLPCSCRETSIAFMGVGTFNGFHFCEDYHPFDQFFSNLLVQGGFEHFHDCRQADRYLAC